MLCEKLDFIFDTIHIALSILSILMILTKNSALHFVQLGEQLVSLFVISVIVVIYGKIIEHHHCVRMFPAVKLAAYLIRLFVQGNNHII